MNDSSKFDAEDFLVDNTFQSYCAGTDKQCVAYWEKYINAHPEQQPTINEAKRLYAILSGNKRRLNDQFEAFKNKVDPPIKKINAYKNLNWLKIAAAIVVVTSMVFLYRNYITDHIPQKELKAQLFSTKSGERKKITLSDGSIVFLNAESSLAIGKDFNDKNREVTLIGEAYFDVIHKKKKPFKVHTVDFNINVLGTAFNVRAYPDEATSEATLIRGLINMETIGSNGGIITLKPSQKVIFYKSTPAKIKSKALKPVVSHPEITINRYTLIKDSTIVETAWTQNRIEIYDQNFDEIKGVLEKWFNVEITIADTELKKYRFTATFSHENIEQVLAALQKVENFKYEIKGNKVLISK